MVSLNWPAEMLADDGDGQAWMHPESNICLDFHGDPVKARLVVFSDGNHHMALQEALDQFQKQYPNCGHIFYVTTPPGPIVNFLRGGDLRIGNLVLSVKPHIFMSPPHILATLQRDGSIAHHAPFMQNRGNVLLVRKGNPKNIRGIKELIRSGIRLFLSNPMTEAVSYNGYRETLLGLAAREGLNGRFLEVKKAAKEIIYGEKIHHREAPQALADGRADAAVLYYHLALRFCRIFPEHFELIPLGGTVDNIQPGPENLISLTQAGIIGDGGEWGERFFNFLFSETVTDIYAGHGMTRPKDTA